MSAIRSAMPDYFSRDAVRDAQALTDRTQRFAPLCQTLTGYAIERAQSGNSNGVAPFANFADSVKGVNGPKFRALIAHVMGIKPASIKSADISTYEDFALSFEAELLALVAPKESKPRATPTNWKAVAEAAQADVKVWKAVAEAAQAERDAMAQELTALKASTMQPA
jgi:hypothetical protein